MGGGKRRIPESRKRLGRVRAIELQVRGAAAGTGPAAHEIDLDVPLCEREHAVAFRFTPGSPVAVVEEAIGIAAGIPPVLVAHGKRIGSLTDERQVQTLQGCLDQGYAIFGRIVSFDVDRGEGLAEVVGVRSRS